MDNISVTTEAPHNPESYSTNSEKLPPKKLSVKRIAAGLSLVMISSVALVYADLFLPEYEIPSINPQTLNADFEDKPIHVSGKINDDVFTDPIFNFSFNGLALKRHVEFYQYTADNNSMIWSEALITDKDKKNPIQEDLLIPSEIWETKLLQLGTFKLSDSIQKKILQIVMLEPIELTQTNFEQLNEDGQKAFKLIDHTYYFGVNPQVPEIGDMRIQFLGKKAPIISILAKQHQDQLTTFSYLNQPIERVALNHQDATQMTKDIKIKQNPAMVWLIRLGLLLPVFIGVMLIFSRNRKPVSRNFSDYLSADNTSPLSPMAQTKPVTEETPATPITPSPDKKNHFVAKSAPQEHHFFETDLEEDHPAITEPKPTPNPVAPTFPAAKPHNLSAPSDTIKPDAPKSPFDPSSKPSLKENPSNRPIPLAPEGIEKDIFPANVEIINSETFATKPVASPADTQPLTRKPTSEAQAYVYNPAFRTIPTEPDSHGLTEAPIPTAPLPSLDDAPLIEEEAPEPSSSYQETPVQSERPAAMPQPAPPPAPKRQSIAELPPPPSLNKRTPKEAIKSEIATPTAAPKNKEKSNEDGGYTQPNDDNSPLFSAMDLDDEEFFTEEDTDKK